MGIKWVVDTCREYLILGHTLENKPQEVCHLASYLAALMSTWRIFTAANAWTWNSHAWSGSTRGTLKLMKMKIRRRRGVFSHGISPYSTKDTLRLYLGLVVMDICFLTYSTDCFVSKDAFEPVEIIRE